MEFIERPLSPARNWLMDDGDTSVAWQMLAGDSLDSRITLRTLSNNSLIVLLFLQSSYEDIDGLQKVNIYRWFLLVPYRPGRLNSALLRVGLTDAVHQSRSLTQCTPATAQRSSEHNFRCERRELGRGAGFEPTASVRRYQASAMRHEVSVIVGGSLV